MSSPLTSQLVKDFWLHMELTFDSNVVQKDESALMDAAASLLDALDIQDRDEFMKNFVTTLYKNIYVPFDVGDDKDPRWSLWGQVRVCVHEHQHVVQANRDGLAIFASRYLASSSYRAGYEAEAFGCDMEMEYWKSGPAFDIAQFAQDRPLVLKSYGCSESDIQMARDMLAVREIVVRNGVIENKATEVAIKWLEANVPDLREVII